MAELKTKPGSGDVMALLKTIEPKSKREDSFRILQIMAELTGDEPVLWGPSIIGFGNVHLKYASGRELDWFKVGFSPRKQNISLYLMNGFGNYSSLMSALGKYKTGVSCLYISKLADVDMLVLKELIAESVKRQPDYVV
ncbi:MAG: hypothetical protein CVT94_16985 [Bacteroidetes bacterium HGW-Bacteroidetes-11]|jgi:hypothetical protein|nr:MAG: hypothetical protein CVT94_16985 [Bacteroidetes bacterium HGW-Bacteroidetes-11]